MKISNLALAKWLLITSWSSLHSISSIRWKTVTVKNETPQEFIVKLVNLESSQETLIEVLNPQNVGQDVIRLSVPPELYGITIYYAPTNKTTNISVKVLRSGLAPGSNCAQITLKPRLYI